MCVTRYTFTGGQYGLCYVAFGIICYVYRLFTALLTVPVCFSLGCSLRKCSEPIRKTNLKLRGLYIEIGYSTNR